MKITAPTVCPSCGYTLSRVNAQLFCLNSVDCTAQSSKKVQNFCKKLKIKGFGDSTIDKLGLTDFNDLISLTVENAEAAGLSNLMANKLVGVIAARLKLGIAPNDFLAACSIPLIGDGAMRKLKFDNISNITYDMCKEHGIGNIAATNLMNWIDTEWYKYENVWSEFFKKPSSKANPTKELPTVCITGKLMDFPNRSAASDHLASLGFQMKSSVTKQVQYLINETGANTSSSCKKAEDYGITITTIKNLEEKYVK